MVAPSDRKCSFYDQSSLQLLKGLLTFPTKNCDMLMCARQKAVVSVDDIILSHQQPTLKLGMNKLYSVDCRLYKKVQFTRLFDYFAMYLEV